MDTTLVLQPSTDFTLNTQPPSNPHSIPAAKSFGSHGILEDDVDEELAHSSPMIMRSPEAEGNFVRKLPSCSSNSNDTDTENLFPPRKSSVASSATSTGTLDTASIDKETRSPLKPLRSRMSRSPTRDSQRPNIKSVRRQSVNRFPVKVNVTRPISPPIVEESMLPQETMALDEDHAMKNKLSGESLSSEPTLTVKHESSHTPDEDVEDEDFDMTAYSQFSAVPDMTMFAKLEKSPNKAMDGLQSSTKHKTMLSDGGSDMDKVTTPTKTNNLNGGNGDAYGNTTNLMVDFTQQFDQFQRPKMSPSKTAPNLLNYTSSARTPSPVKHRQMPSNSRMSNLLDFDIPPAPTPRSMPSITPRELETLKSNFLSEISSLKSSLMGSQAEVQFLKTAMNDAEKRVGTCMEQLREASTLRAQWEAEKESWENRGREMEDVMRNVQEEIRHVEEDRERLEGRLQESEMRREAAESMAQEAESKMAGMRAASAVLSHSTDPDKKSTSSSREVEIQVEKVARELHTLYKGKHEAKVAALKKSYESKWDKKIRQLEEQLETSKRENEHLRLQNGEDTNKAETNRVDEARQAAEAERTRELELRLRATQEEMGSVKKDHDLLRRELERERQEKGELVIACDELLALQSTEPMPMKEAPIRETLSASTRLPPSKPMATTSSPRRPVSTLGLPRPGSSGSNEGAVARPGLPKARPMSMMRAPGAYSGAPGTPLASRIGKMGGLSRRGVE